MARILTSRIFKVVLIREIWLRQSNNFVLLEICFVCKTIAMQLHAILLQNMDNILGDCQAGDKETLGIVI